MNIAFRLLLSVGVRWHLSFQWSLRDVEELLFERSVTVAHETILYWRDKSGTGLAHGVKAARRILQLCCNQGQPSVSAIRLWPDRNFFVV